MMRNSILIMQLSPLTDVLLYSWIFLYHLTYSIEIHELMTDEQFKDVFGGSRGNVPEYEVTQIYHSINTQEIREDNPISFEAFGEAIKLNLRLVPYIRIPVWIAFGVKNGNITDGVRYKMTDPFLVNNAVKFYEDPTNMASVGIERDRYGHLRFTGAIGDRLILRPISQELIDAWRGLYKAKKRRSIGDSQFSATSNYHIIIKNNQQIENIVERSTSNEESMKIFPRLLIFTHYRERYTSELEVRFFGFLIYQLAFWHSVNLRFAQFSNPSIQLQIAGIVVNVDETAAPYFNRNMVTSGKGINNGRALEEFGRWIKDNSPTSRNSWDIAVVLTDWPMCDSPDCQTFVSGGVSWVASDCNITEPYIYMAAIVQDDLAFNGITAATHELGHLFGAVHDGKDEGKCRNERKIMEPLARRIKKNFQWSNCSIQAISQHIKKTYPYCWKAIAEKNSHLIVAEISEILPGQLVSPTEQCRRRNYKFSCDIDVSICTDLRCYVPDIFGSSLFSRCYGTGPALDGTQCGVVSRCKAGRCI